MSALTFFIFFLTTFSTISNSYSIEPDVFVQSTVNRASEALNNKFTKEEKIGKLKNIADETVDIIKNLKKKYIRCDKV